MPAYSGRDLKRNRQEWWTTQRHKGYATTDIPVFKVPSVNTWVRETVSARLFPAIRSKYQFPASTRIGFKDLFFVKYEARVGKQADLPLHCDNSTVSFNILLNSNTEFDEGGTYFQHLDRSVKGNQGDALIHSGFVKHAGALITRGKRFVLVGFLGVVHMQ